MDRSSLRPGREQGPAGTRIPRLAQAGPQTGRPPPPPQSSLAAPAGKTTSSKPTPSRSGRRRRRNHHPRCLERSRPGTCRRPGRPASGADTRGTGYRGAISHSRSRALRTAPGPRLPTSRPGQPCCCPPATTGTAAPLAGPSASAAPRPAAAPTAAPATPDGRDAANALVPVQPTPQPVPVPAAEGRPGPSGPGDC